MLVAFNDAVAESQAAVREFTDLMGEAKSQAIFAQAQKSRDANPSGITPWTHSDHPDWFRLDPNQA